MRPEKQPRWAAGDEFTREQANDRSRAIERINNLAVDSASGLELQRAGSGLLLRDQSGDDPFLAQLSGASSPYSWTKYVETAAGTLTATSITGASNAYEMNGRTGLSGKYVRLYPDAFGGFRFTAKKCCSGGGSVCSSGTVSFRTDGCSSQPIPGSSVTITGPSGSGFSSSGTTDSSGTYGDSLVGYPSGTYTATSSKARYNNGSGSVVITSCASGAGVITMTPATGYYCDPCRSYQAIPPTLTFTTSYGMTITLTRTGGSPYPFYSGSTTFGGSNYTLTFAHNGTGCEILLVVLFVSSEIVVGTVTPDPYSVYFTGLNPPGGPAGSATATITE